MMVIGRTDPLLIVEGMPEVRVEPGPTILLTWEDGRLERHTYADIIPKGEFIFIDEDAAMIEAHENLKRVIDELKSRKFSPPFQEWQKRSK